MKNKLMTFSALALLVGGFTMNGEANAVGAPVAPLAHPGTPNVSEVAGKPMEAGSPIVADSMDARAAGDPIAADSFGKTPLAAAKAPGNLKSRFRCHTVEDPNGRSRTHCESTI